jgi:bifunctional non-homologous end joining protein LigD
VTTATSGAAAEGGNVREIDGRSVRVTHPERVVWPLTGTTKGDLIDYLLAVAPVLLPHLRDRATMLWRFPEGVEGPGWFQAQCRSRPAWVPTHEVTGRRGEVLRYCVIQEPATLVWLANLGTIEFHPHLWLTSAPPEPAPLVFDLDPGPPAGLADAASVALAVERRVRDAGLEPLVKTSGSLGLHVVAPLAPGATFGATKAFARHVAEELAVESPDRVVARSGRAERQGRVYIDWVQNDRNRQLVAPYSPRATPLPGVSLPLTWDEVRRAAAGDLGDLRPDLLGTLRRLGAVGDLWEVGRTRAGHLPPGKV